MPTVVGIRFKKAGKIYYFDPALSSVAQGDHAIVETARGVEYGEVVVGPREVSDSEVVSPLKPVLRKATDEDAQKVEENIVREKEAFNICLRKITNHDLPMRLIDVEFTFDVNKIIFYFTAEGRIDFRELVKDLAHHFRTRIELRQIGVRDEAKLLGGLGKCGCPVCCQRFLPEFSPVSIKMAKEQNISLNPTKISGLCGRLMCCLNYEQPYYEEMRKKLPRNGSNVKTPDGIGVAMESNPISLLVKVKIQKPDDTFEIREYKLKEISFERTRPPKKQESKPKKQEKKPQDGEKKQKKQTQNDKH